jgi:hypothetical protein
MIVLGQTKEAPPGGDHNRERGPVQIIFTKKNIILPHARRWINSAAI